jgi:hypothetical protein
VNAMPKPRTDFGRVSAQPCLASTARNHSARRRPSPLDCRALPVHKPLR